MMKVIREEDFFRVIIIGSIALLSLLATTGLIFYGRKTGLGILAGGMISIANFFWLRNVLQRILGLLPSRPFLYSQVRFIGRITVTAIALYLIIISGWFSLTGILVGLSIIVLNIIALSLYSTLRAGG
jgi:ATP synthase I chain